MKKRILFFVTRYLCYASNEYFAEQIAFNLKELGHNVEICNISNNQFGENELEKYIGKKYDAIIDFNSILPRVKVGEEYFLDLLEGEFYNYILDHPLYHHPILSIELKNYNVICIDENHKKYIEEKYNNINNVYFLPLAASKAPCDMPVARKKDAILFPATYYDVKKYYNMINEQDAEKRKILLDMIDLMKENSKLSAEKAFETVCEDILDIKDNKEYTQKLNSLYLAEYYVRALNREKVLRTFADLRTDIIVLGNEWEKCTDINRERITFIEGKDYISSLDLIASCKYVLNVLPGFTCGGHDRMVTAMLNKTLVISDTNDYLDRNFKNLFLSYDINKLEESTKKIDDMLNLARKNMMFNQNILGTSIVKAYNKVSENFTWKEHANKLNLFLTQN